MASYNANSAVATAAAAAGEPAEETGGAGVTVGYVKVMTEEQVEVLRMQISIYAALCEQLAEMHRAFTARQDSLAGTRLGDPYFDDPLTVHGGHHKITARQRWTPTWMQLRILESLFEQGDGTPGKRKIEDITAELSQHGRISETNVYNWFQNRRARSKRKQQDASVLVLNNGESEPERDEESPTDKKARSDRSWQQQQQQQSMAMGAHNPERFSEIHHLDMEHEHSTMYGSNDHNDSGPSGSMGQMSFYETILSNPGMDEEHEHGTMYGSNDDNGSGSSGSMGQISFYETILSNPGMDTEHEHEHGTMHGSNDDNGSGPSGSMGQMTFYETILSNPEMDTEHEHGTMYGSNDDNGSGPSSSMDQMSFYETILSNPGTDDQFQEWASTSFSQLCPGGSFDMYG